MRWRLFPDNMGWVAARFAPDVHDDLDDGALLLDAFTGHAGGAAAFVWWAVASQSGPEIAEFVPQRRRRRTPHPDRRRSRRWRA